MSYPKPLQEIVDLLEHLPEQEKRENLIAFADQAALQEPQETETFELEDVRKDEECTDTVGIYLKVNEEGQAHFRVTLGPQVQTLTRAMTTLLCQGLEGATCEEILDLDQDFVPRVVGGELVRQRSQTVYYVLTRMKSACKVYLNRKRRNASAP